MLRRPDMTGIEAAEQGVDRRVIFNTTNGFELPDETVLIKSFALELEAGNTASRRWIETRFMTRQEGEWVGYSYLWNDAQTDADLVDRRGIDKTYTIRDPKTEGGARQQTWHYPSRTECMVCHSRAANYVLGLSELQFNRDFQYGDVTDNQIRALAHIGLLSGAPAEKKPGDPKPIPGGFSAAFEPVPADPFIHVLPPFLPFEMSTIGDFDGTIGAADIQGTAHGSDGTTYTFDADMRFMQGTYVDTAGNTQHGSFAFI